MLHEVLQAMGRERGGVVLLILHQSTRTVCVVDTLYLNVALVHALAHVLLCLFADKSKHCPFIGQISIVFT